MCESSILHGKITDSTVYLVDVEYQVQLTYIFKTLVKRFDKNLKQHSNNF